MSVRQRAKLNQVVCTLEGMCFRLQMTPGEFAVVIHGDRDCANVLFSGMDFPGSNRFFCTNLSGDQALAGRSSRRLEQCLELVCRETGPQVVFLLGTCLSALIGEQSQEIARQVTQRTGSRILALPGAGMRFVSQAEICDRFASLMLGAAEAADPDGRAVNLIGFHPGQEVLSLLDKLGIRVNSLLDLSASLSAWKALGRAGTNLVVDRGLFQAFLGQTESRLGQSTVEVPFPVGARATSGFFRNVTRAIEPRDKSCLVEPAGKAQAAVDQAARRIRGKRLGYNIGSLKNLDPQSLALEGLSVLPVFEELDLEPTILVQGDDRPERLSAVRGCLAGFGCRHPVEVFSDTVFFLDLCRKLELDLVYAADHLGGGPGFLPIGSLQPGFAGVTANLERILGALDG